MDFYRFINSRNIRNYHQEVKYEYNAAEAAWLVYQCRDACVEEKHSAWKWIIDNMDDYEVAKRVNYHASPSIKTMIEQYMMLEDRVIAEFYKNSGVYSYSALYQDESESEWCECDVLFCDFETCWNRKDTNNDIVRYRIRKRYLDDSREITIEFDRERMEYVRSIYHNVRWDFSSEEIDLVTAFMGLWFDFPTPFKRGDIIWDPERTSCDRLCSGPFVNLGVCLEGIENERVRDNIIANGDESDMTVGGYFVFRDGQVYYEVVHNYMDIEFYPQMLDGALRTLITISNYIKGEIGLDLCIRSYHQILMEALAEDARVRDYDEKRLKSLGLEI